MTVSEASCRHKNKLAFLLLNLELLLRLTCVVWFGTFTNTTVTGSKEGVRLGFEI